MMQHTLAHLSDLHLGHGPAREAAARALVEAVQEAHVDHVVVTGDLTQRGRDEEMSLFLDIFAPLQRAHRLTVVPGNHDRTCERSSFRSARRVGRGTAWPVPGAHGLHRRPQSIFLGLPR